MPDQPIQLYLIVLIIAVFYWAVNKLKNIFKK